MDNFLLLPPIAFLIFLFLSMGISLFTRIFSAKGKESAGKGTAYACGQITETNKIQPDYREFFPFAFFFTIMHVVVLIIATMPDKSAMWMVIVYIAIAVLALRILFRR